MAARGNERRREVTKFLKELSRRGLVIEQTKHHKVKTADGRTVLTVAHSPGSRQWKKVAIRRLRENGVDVTGLHA